MVLVSKAEKRAIFTYLLKEGVIVVRKDSYLPRHQSITDVPNLKVMMIVKSLVSQGYLNQVFNWQWNYYTVTNKGVTFLAKALGKSYFEFTFSPTLSHYLKGNYVRLLISLVSLCDLGVNANVVPSTYKQKKSLVQAAKAEDGDEKAAAGAPAEGETPTPMGRGRA